MLARSWTFLYHSEISSDKVEHRGQNIDIVTKLFLALCACLAFAAPATFAENGGFRLISSEWHDGGTVPQENVFNARDVAGPICLRSFIGLTLQAARRALLSLSLIPTLRIMADGGIGLFLIFREQSRSYL